MYIRLEIPQYILESGLAGTGMIAVTQPRKVAATSLASRVALAAKMHDTKATILMPLDAPASKVEATRGYGAEIVTYDRYTEDREVRANALSEQRGLTPIPAYDNFDVMAGAGTTALELIETAGPVDVFLACTSGGGLTAGDATTRGNLGVLVVGARHPELGVEREDQHEDKQQPEERVRQEGMAREDVDEGHGGSNGIGSDGTGRSGSDGNVAHLNQNRRFASANRRIGNRRRPF